MYQILKKNQLTRNTFLTLFPGGRRERGDPGNEVVFFFVRRAVSTKTLLSIMTELFNSRPNIQTFFTSSSLKPCFYTALSLRIH